MRKKLIGVFALTLLLSSCGVFKDDYQSLRHKDELEDNQKLEDFLSEESTEIRYTSDGNLDDQSLEEDENVEEEFLEEEYFYNDQFIINMRRAPSLESEILVEIPINSEILLYGKNGEWTKASFAGFDGYILTEILKEN